MYKSRCNWGLKAFIKIYLAPHSGCVLNNIFSIILYDFVPSQSKLFTNTASVQTQYLQDSEQSEKSSEGSGSLEPKMAETHTVEKNKVHTDIQLCSMVCGRPIDRIIAILGTYCCQALVINALFLVLSNIAQWIQREFNVDTSSLFSGKFYGLLTVTFGSYVSYKVSELLVDAILIAFKDSVLAHRMREVIDPSKSSLACINVPILLLYRCSKYLHNRLPPNLASLDIHIKNQLLGSGGAEDDVNEDLRISLKSPSPNRGRFKRELAVISGYGLGTFLLLGGRYVGFCPFLTVIQSTLVHSE